MSAGAVKGECVMAHDIGKLEERIRAFDLKISQLESLHARLGPIVHGPGWTSLAEFALVNLAMDALESHANSISHTQTELVRCAQLIEREDSNSYPGNVSHGGPGSSPADRGI
jgi:hypothetical protein